MKKFLMLLAGLGLGLGLGEMAASHRDQGGFPNFNGYVPDPKLGVRLEPDFDATLVFLTNPVAKIHVNHQGYRGADWPDGGTGEIAVIGDSQVFGLGVDDDQTASALLGPLAARSVLNVGVPTYGPDEYLAMIDEVAERKPSQIVVVINFANDLFELGEPNTARHVVLDGWALRGATVPEHMEFPGRSWLFQRSHLVYAARQLAHADEHDASVVANVPALLKPPMDPPPLTSASLDPKLDAALRDQQRAEDDVAVYLYNLELVPGEPEPIPEAWGAIHALRDDVREGEIYSLPGEEGGELKVQVTAGWLRAASRLRESAPAKMRSWLAKNNGLGTKSTYWKALHAYDQATARVAALRGFAVVEPERASAFRGFLAAAASHAAKAGAQLTVVVLPMDIQVDPNEFKKYGQEPQDLSTTAALLDDLCRDAAHLGARCLNATEALRAAEPGAFLDGDLHMTAKGQAALAQALARTLSAPAPVPTPLPGLPEGRTPMPLDREWTEVGEITVTGSTAAGCKTSQIREYLRVDCRSKPTGLTKPPYQDADPNGPAWLDYYARLVYTSHLVGLEVVSGPEDRWTLQEDDHAGLVIPILPGQEVTADFFWSDHVSRLVVHPGADPVGAFIDQPMRAAPAAISASQTCAPGGLVAGAAGRCLPLCDPDQACAHGVCGDWQGYTLCL